MIYLLWPTVRPEVMKTTHAQWIAHAADPSKIITHICVNTEEQAEELSEDFDTIYISGDEIRGVAGPSYVLGSKLKANPQDIVILASDDFYPAKHWDKWVKKHLLGYDGALLVNDGYQHTGCVTIPIMTFNCLRRLNGIIYHPDYKHLYSDNELYEVLKSLKLLKNLRKDSCVFEHRHYDNGKRKRDQNDNLAQRSSHHAQQTFGKRRKLKIKDKLLVSDQWKKYAQEARKYTSSN
jgi:hypothetical protein